MEQALDGGIAIRVRMFGWTAFTLLGAALFWNGFIIMPVRQLIIMVAGAFGWTLPEWVKSANGASGNLLAGSFIGFFLIPFIAVGIWLIWSTIFYFFGQCVIRFSYSEGSVFTGIGSFGRTRKFSLKSVKSVYIADVDEDGNFIRRSIIEMNNGREIKIPYHLGKMRNTWVLFALKKNLGRKTPADIII